MKRKAMCIKQEGFGPGAKPIVQYITCVPAEEMVRRGKIAKRTSKRKRGYQRSLQKSRLKKGKYGIPGYLLDQLGVFPTSVLVNIRKTDGVVKFKSETEVGPEIEVGELEIPEGLTWWIIDGQHRIEGIEAAWLKPGGETEKEDTEREKKLRKYPMILTITNESIFYEMLVFYLVNKRQKSVPTDLAYRILQRILYEGKYEGKEKSPKWALEMMTPADSRKAIAATIVDYLNKEFESPLRGRIQEIGEPEDDFLVKDGQLIKYTSYVVKAEILGDMWDRDLAELLANYWRAIGSIWPRCFEQPKNHVLLKTLGLSSLSRLFPAIYGHCIKSGDVSAKTMEKYLRYLLEKTPNHNEPAFERPIDEDWWNVHEGPGAILKGTGEGHYKSVKDWLAQKINLAIEKGEKK